MESNCKLPGRNLCAPGGKISALFVDVDGTIMECEPYFAAARARFGYLMKMQGFESESSIELARGIYMEYMQRNGVERDQMSLAFVSAYKRLCRKHKVKQVKEVIGICEDLGRSPFFREPELFANAAPVLNRARHNFLIIGVTMGNREAQKFKIRQAGLDAVFDHYIITPYDNKAERVRELIADLNIDPEHSAFIGNSLKSDGSCLSETNFIHVPFERGVFDQSSTPEGSGFEMFSVRDWRDAEERGLQRLVIRRDLALEREKARGETHNCKRKCHEKK